jgi:hypothetical protein
MCGHCGEFGVSVSAKRMGVIYVISNELHHSMGVGARSFASANAVRMCVRWHYLWTAELPDREGHPRPTETRAGGRGKEGGKMKDRPIK